MARPLPYMVKTDTGEQYQIEFPLHPSTESPMLVYQLLEDILHTITASVRSKEMSNGDILQATSMALAVRARIIASNPEVTSQLALDLVADMLNATKNSSVSSPLIGNA